MKGPITLHGVDTLCAMLGYWHEAVRDADVSLDIKTCDLRKACKQLCVSSNALADTYLAVWNPHLRKTEVYGQYALPFGSCASVHAFCRSSLALWRIGISRMRFDDFVIFSRPALSRHTEFSLRFFPGSRLDHFIRQRALVKRSSTSRPSITRRTGGTSCGKL